jgi:hypothetical protein
VCGAGEGGKRKVVTTGTEGGNVLLQGQRGSAVSLYGWIEDKQMAGETRQTNQVEYLLVVCCGVVRSLQYQHFFAHVGCPLQHATPHMTEVY